MVQNLLPDFHGTLIIRLEEVIGAVVLDRLPAVLSNIKDYNTQKSNKHETLLRRQKHGLVPSGKPPQASDVSS